MELLMTILKQEELDELVDYISIDDSNYAEFAEALLNILDHLDLISDDTMNAVKKELYTILQIYKIHAIIEKKDITIERIAWET